MNPYVQTFRKYQFLLSQLISRDLKVKYRRSVLGILWSVLNPLLMMLILTAVFSHVFRGQVENFPVYYLTGWLMYNFVVEATSGALTSILDNANLIKKVYIPKYIFPLEKCLFSCVNTLFSLVAVLVVILIVRFPLSWTFLLFPIPLLYALLFSIGLGMLLAALYVYLRDMKYLYGVFTTAWMYLTPIIYPESMIDTMPVIPVLMKINPMYYFVTYFRTIVMYRSLPDLTLNLGCLICAAAMLALGGFVFYRLQGRFILHL